MNRQNPPDAILREVYLRSGDKPFERIEDLISEAELRGLAALPDGPPASEGDDGIATATIQLIGASLRITDRAWLEDGDAVILLPESDRATAEAFAERLRAAAPGRFTDRIAFAAFPDDGLTSSALLDALERGMHGSPVPSPLVRTTIAGAPADLAAVIATVDDQVESGIG